MFTLGIEPQQVIDVVEAAANDEEIDAGLKIFPEDLKVHLWNRKVVQMGMSEMGREALDMAKKKMGILDRTDVISFCDMIEIDEGRSTLIFKNPQIMNLEAIMYAFGLSGLFASRAFLPAFVTALLMKYQDSIPMIGDWGILKLLRQLLNGLLMSTLLWGSRILSVAEILSDKNPDLQETLSLVHQYAKPAMAGLTYMGVLTASDVGFINQQIAFAGILDIIPAGLVSGFVYFLVQNKEGVQLLLRESDEDDSLGIAKSH